MREGRESIAGTRLEVGEAVARVPLGLAELVRGADLEVMEFLFSLRELRCVLLGAVVAEVRVPRDWEEIAEAALAAARLIPRAVLRPSLERAAGARAALSIQTAFGMEALVTTGW